MTTHCHGLAAHHLEASRNAEGVPSQSFRAVEETPMPEPVGDATMSALHYALSGLALRQRTIADNTANIETPGFLAGKVSFEDTLRSSIADGSDPFAAAPQTTAARWSRPAPTATTSTSTRRRSPGRRRT